MGSILLHILGVSGSPRIGGNTDLILNEALAASKSSGVETKLIRLSDYSLAPCNGCMACFATGNCAIKDDWQKLYNEITEADGIVLASPSYFQGVTAQMKIFIDRIGFLALARKRADFAGKVGGAIAVARKIRRFQHMQSNDYFPDSHWRGNSKRRQSLRHRKRQRRSPKRQRRYRNRKAARQRDSKSITIIGAGEGVRTSESRVMSPPNLRRYIPFFFEQLYFGPLIELPDCARGYFPSNNKMKKR